MRWQRSMLPRTSDRIFAKFIKYLAWIVDKIVGFWNPLQKWFITNGVNKSVPTWFTTAVAFMRNFVVHIHTDSWRRKKNSFYKCQKNMNELREEWVVCRSAKANASEFAATILTKSLYHFPVSVFSERCRHISHHTSLIYWCKRTILLFIVGHRIAQRLHHSTAS